MMPENRLSSEPVLGEFLAPDNIPFRPTSDWELGGVAHQDTSLGIDHQVWRADLVGNVIVVTGDNGQSFSVPANASATYISLAFDRNNRVVLAWLLGTVLYYYWYDPVIEGFTTDSLQGVSSVRLCHDDKRADATLWSDVLMVYTTGTALVVRNQRDRYLAPHILNQGVGRLRLRALGMTTVNRVQMDLR